MSYLSGGGRANADEINNLGYTGRLAHRCGAWAGPAPQRVGAQFIAPDSTSEAMSSP
ncbi:MAG: hypothetical protein ACYDER_19025 [Ktedonobacteraceae bacterium]